MGNESNRAKAIGSLQYLRDYLEDQRRQFPDPRRLVDFSMAERFNEAIRLVRDEIGEDIVRAVTYRQPPTRDALLSQVVSMLDRLERIE